MNLNIFKKKKPNPSKKKKSVTREWLDAIVFAVVAATIIRGLFIEAFTIPTPSMEKSLLVGDFLFVSKVNYGPRTPITPLAFPFSHHTLPLTSTAKSYLEWIKLPYYRIPGFQDIKRNDVVVFNFPAGDTVALAMQDRSYYDLVRENGWEVVNGNPQFFGEITARPIDKRENYIKRCVAIAGDTLEIKNTIVYINGIAQETPPEGETTYLLKTEGTDLNPKLINDMGLAKEGGKTSLNGDYIFNLTTEGKQKLSALPNVKYITQNINKNPTDRVYPNQIDFNWNEDNYGPIYIPKAGTSIELTPKNVALYKRVIRVYEDNVWEEKEGRIFINGTETTTYTFKQNYYWLMGDNRHNSLDSRFWGFVPEDHVVGKALFIWMSWDANGSFFSKIRWSRLFSSIK
jgi:signal peptidase I